MTRRLHRSAALAAIFCAACGSQAFTPQFREVAQPEFSRVTRAIVEAPPREEEPVVVGIGGEPATLFAWNVRDGRALWMRRVSDESRSAPIVAGAYVVTHEGDEIIVRELANGHEAFTIDAEGKRLVGADGERTDVAIAISEGPEQSPRGLLVFARDGSVSWRHELQLPVGVPAVRNGIVIVPWATQRVSFLDASDGRERTRVRITDDVIAHAFVDPTGVYLGQHGLFRFTPAIESGSKTQAAYYQPRGRPLPGQPTLLRDGYMPMPPPEGAQHRIRLVWRPAGTGEEVSLADGAIHLVFYRFVFSMQAEEDALRWVYTHPQDIVGASGVDGGVVVVAEDGSMAMVSNAGGRVVWQAEMALPVRAASVRLGTFVPPAAAAAAPAEGQPVATEPPSIAQSLWEAARLDDARLAAGRALAVRHLARFEEADVTGQLVTLCGERSSPEPVRVAACNALGERTTGDEHVRVALQARGSFLEGTPAPPVGALAKAAASMNMRNAVPALVRHLEDPATPVAELAGLIEGLGRLHATSAATPVEEFFRLYHADSGDPALTAAVAAAADALAAIQGRAAERTLQVVADDPLSETSVRERARAAVAALRAPPAAATPAGAAPATEPPAQPRAPARDAQPAREGATPARGATPERTPAAPATGSSDGAPRSSG